MKAFENFHPIILFFYFLGVIAVTMFTPNPIVIGISFIASVLFCGMLDGFKNLFKSLAYGIPMLLMISVTNPLFSHNGETILFFLNDNPVTLEAIYYGLAIGTMLMAVFYWFKCFNIVMTSDKFIYLFGRVFPKLALLLSMSLGFLPKFKRQFKEIDDAQKALGIYTSKSFVDKIRSKMRALGILISWSLENSLQTADSMRARGYGLKGRSSYSIFNWTVRDTLFIILYSVLIASVCFLLGNKIGEFAYYPVITAIGLNGLSVGLYVCVFLTMLLPTLVEMKENILWRYLKSKI